MRLKCRFNKGIMYDLAKKYSGYSMPPRRSKETLFRKTVDWAELNFIEPDNHRQVIVECSPSYGKMHLVVKHHEFGEYEKIVTLPEEDFMEIIPDEEMRAAFIRTGEIWDKMFFSAFRNL